MREAGRFLAAALAVGRGGAGAAERRAAIVSHGASGFVGEDDPGLREPEPDIALEGGSGAGRRGCQGNWSGGRNPPLAGGAGGAVGQVGLVCGKTEMDRGIRHGWSGWVHGFDNQPVKWMEGADCARRIRPIPAGQRESGRLLARQVLKTLPSQNPAHQRLLHTRPARLRNVDEGEGDWIGCQHVLCFNAF